MATLQKIRNKGKLLIATVGIALFAFIAEEFVRSLSYSQSESRLRIGKIYGEDINVQDFNAMVDEYTDVIKFSNGMNTLNDHQMSMLRDQVWQTLVNQKLIEHECEKLGLTVTDAELQEIINTGRNPLLIQSPFRTQQGTFDANQLKQFLSQYDEIINNPEITSDVKEQYTQMYNYWKFVEKSIRQQTLDQKYQSLLSSAIISNPVAAKANYEGRVNESEILLAALPYTSIKDTDIEVEDSELKAKYEEIKEMFSTTQETRDIKYIDINVVASDADKAALTKELEEFAQNLNDGANPAKIVREAGSMIAYSALPVSRKSLPTDIAKELDSLNVGEQKGPYTNADDNTMNIIRYISKVELPDSVEVRQIVAPGTDMASAEKTADSILNALKDGANFDTIAKKYDQPATKNWIVSAQYEGQLIDENNRKFIETISNASVNTYHKIVLDGQGVIVTQVTDRKNIIEKYNLAIIKRSIDFSKETYGKAYNDFSSFLAGNPTSEDIEANAGKAGYSVLTRQNMSSAEHAVANVHGTQETMRWIFNEDTNVGDVSPLYECGENDHMMVVILTGVHPKGYLAWDDAQVKTYLTSEVLKDKKAAMLQEKIQNAKSIADITKIEGALTDTVKHVNFASNTFVTRMGSSEPVLSGSVSTAKQGDFKAGVKGNAAVYAYQVLNQNKLGTQFDQKKEEQQATQNTMRALNSYTSELYKNAGVEDKRYLFY